MVRYLTALLAVGSKNRKNVREFVTFSYVSHLSMRPKNDEVILSSFEERNRTVYLKFE